MLLKILRTGRNYCASDAILSSSPPLDPSKFDRSNYGVATAYGKSNFVQEEKEKLSLLSYENLFNPGKIQTMLRIRKWLRG